MCNLRKGKRLNVLVLGGHYHGCNALWALLTMSTLRAVFDVVGLWADWHNNETNRLWRHHRKGKARDRARQRIVDYAQRLGLARGRIICRPFDGRRLCSLIKRLNVDVIVIATFGGKVPREAIELVDGNVFVCHPCFEIEDDDETLPQISRGARVMDKIVREGGIQAAMQIALLRANEKFDDGPIVGVTRVFAGPLFDPEDMICSREAWRNIEAQKISASFVGSLLRDHLIRQVVTPKDVLELGFSKQRLFKLGYSYRQLKKAGMKFK